MTAEERHSAHNHESHADAIVHVSCVRHSYEDGTSVHL